ncbi:MAG: heme ABC transporter ATP-binding protein [Rhodobacteraceae bacterium]|nr:heme ABC transporter ATP-binding protein [Paracoccaceae bacterium]
MLEALGVGLSRRGRRILHDVSLIARGGELLALCGPNGAGKSSLLGVLSGDITPSVGAAFLAGALMEGLSPGELARRRAVLEQSPSLSVEFTVVELVALGAEVAPYELVADLSKITAQAMSLAGVTQMAASSVLALSGGERARAHLARVLAQHLAGRMSVGAGALLLDEPTASLDLAHQAETLSIARACARDGAAVVVVLHDLNLAAAFADRIALLCAGELVTAGAPGEVLTPDLLRRVYGVEIEVESGGGAEGRPLLRPNFLAAATRLEARWPR